MKILHPMIGAVLSVGCAAAPAPQPPIEYGDPVPTPVDDEITVLPVEGISSDAFPYIQPTAIGVELDAVVRDDGTLGGYALGDEQVAPGLYLHIVSDAFFAAPDEDVDLRHDCYVWGWWDPKVATGLEAHDGAPFYVDYRGAFVLEDHDCGDLLDPTLHGENGEDFVATLDGLDIGIGFAPLTHELEESWPDAVLDTWRDAMIAAYVAVPLVGEDSFVAHDLSTTFAFEVGPGAERLVTDPDGELVGAAVTNYLPPQSLPDFYAFTIATRYLPLDTLAL